MAQKSLPVWQETNAWREIMARIFEGFDATLNISPTWLVNPATNRRLKLDFLYHDIGVAVRFEGLQGNQRRRRPSLEEEEQQQQRDAARIEVCRAHGVHLIVVDIPATKPQVAFRDIDTMLSRASQDSPDQQAALKQARLTASEISRRIRQPGDLHMYANLWQDRQYQIPEPIAAPTTAPTIAFEVGQTVEHASFGPGIIVTITPDGNDNLLTIDFVERGQKTLAASLVGDKLSPR